MVVMHEARHVDPDFAEEVLADLYTYPRKRKWVAFTLWLLLGWFGAHRFYLERHGTALLMLLSAGGGLVWWVIDAFLLDGMVSLYNRDQELREKLGDPPRELDFMPPLARDVLARPPAWTERWMQSGAGSRTLRLAGDVLVLIVVGVLLGRVARLAGVYEAVFAILLLALLTAAGGAFGRLHDLPVARGLIRWSHRLRLFYYYNKPGSPLALLFRPVTAAVLAPFRQRDRAEVRLYLQLGGVFTLLFLLGDLAEQLVARGLGALGPGSLFRLWIREAAVTFLVIYAFAAPIGAVLTLHLLMRRTHTLARVLSVLVVAAMALGLAACAAGGRVPAVAQDTGPVRNIILMIADGVGPGVWTAADYAADNELAVQRMPVLGLVDTRSANSRVTDSAAGATVYATGERVTNRTISVRGCPQPSARDTLAVEWPGGCTALESWFAIARAKGKATGLVTTTNIVDATPAAFVAHSPSRYWHQYIAVQLAEAELDVMLGGGRDWFAGETRSDGRDLLGTLCAASDCVSNASELARYRAGDRPLVGLFAPGDMDALDRRPVALPDMVEAALARLARDPDGFVAMFETEATDNATHDNAPLERVTADILEFDRAVAVTLEFAQRTPGTLLIVTSDHETGGFSLVETGRDFRLEYTTTGHTASVVPLFAAGPGAQRFGGYRDNVEIGRTLMEIVRAWP
ncbi:MAG TPA: alkaline phosphatase [Longimicrobiales bacterium]